MGKKENLLIDLQLLPSISYFSLMKSHDKILIEQHDNFQKQTYRNRYEVLTSNGVLKLIIPVLHSKSGEKIPYQDIQINYSEDWVTKHLRTLKTAYNNAPYFQFYFPYIEEVFDKRHSALFNLNKDLLNLFIRFLRMKNEIEFTNSYLDGHEHYVDLRDKIGTKKGASEVAFKKYTQVFSNEFFSNLSILDLIFCKGPDAYSLL